MGNVKTTSDVKLKRLDNFIPKYIDVDFLKYAATQQEIVSAINVLIQDYKARYHD